MAIRQTNACRIPGEKALISEPRGGAMFLGMRDEALWYNKRVIIHLAKL